MLIPVVGTGIEKADELPTRPMDRSDVAALGAIAIDTCKGQVVGVRRTPVFLADNMVHLATKISIVCRTRQYSQRLSARFTTNRRKSALT